MGLEALDNQDLVSSRWPSYQPMVLVALAFASGIALDRWFDLSWQFSLFAAFAGLVGWIVIWARDLKANAWMLSSLFLVVALVGSGAFWHHGRWNWFGDNEISRFASDSSQPCCIEAEIISEPRWAVSSAGFKTDSTHGGSPETIRTSLTANVKRIRDGSKWRKASGKIDIVIHLRTDHVSSGDKVRVFGKLVSGAPPSNPGQFNFQEFYRAKSKLAFVHLYHKESCKVIGRKSFSSTKVLPRLRQRLNAMTWEYVSDDEAPFASAIMLGNREQLSKERKDAFLQTGTAHLLAISGLHVGILAGAFFLFFRIGVLSRRNCLFATIVFVFFYAWLVEYRPPVSRAAILVTLFCVGRLMGEKSFSFNLLAIAGMIVLILNPSDLFGLGPQLSFLAVASLTFGRSWVFWSPSRDPIKRLIAGTRPAHVRVLYWMGRQSRTAILVSGLIWLVAMPLVASRFHLFSPIALLVNPILLIPIAWGLYGGLGVMVFGWFLPPAAKVCGWFCDRNLALIEWMLGGAQSLPYSHVWTSGPPPWSVLAFYSGVFLFAIFPPTRMRGKSLIILVLMWILCSWIVPDYVAKRLGTSGDGQLECTFIDVGHGTSVLLQLPDGKNILYDAGSFGAAEYGARNIAGTLWHERIEYLDAVVLSHADVDHFNALPILAERFSIGVVYVTPQMLASDSRAVKDLFKTLEDCGVPVLTLVAGDELMTGATKTKVLGPPKEGTGGNDNSNSVVLMIEHLGKTILLPGDLEQAGLSRLLSQTPIDFDLVMAPHHGSSHSNPEQFMNWSTPEYVVISAGSHRLSDETLQRFRSDPRVVAQTYKHGAVRFQIDRSGLTMQTWNNQPW